MATVGVKGLRDDYIRLSVRLSPTSTLNFHSPEGAAVLGLYRKQEFFIVLRFAGRYLSILVCLLCR